MEAFHEELLSIDTWIMHHNIHTISINFLSTAYTAVTCFSLPSCLFSHTDTLRSTITDTGEHFRNHSQKKMPELLIKHQKWLEKFPSRQSWLLFKINYAKIWRISNPWHLSDPPTPLKYTKLLLKAPFSTFKIFTSRFHH